MLTIPENSESQSSEIDCSNQSQLAVLISPRNFEAATNRDFLQKSLGFSLAIGGLNLIGLPALVLTLAFSALHISEVLPSMQVSSLSLFLLFYIYTFGSFAIFAVVLLIVNLILWFGAKQSLVFCLNEKGFGWVKNWYVRITGVKTFPIGEIPWERLISISDRPQKLIEAAKVNLRVAKLLDNMPRRNIFFCCRREENREGAKQERPIDYVLLVHSFSEEQRLQILRAILHYAPHVPISERAVELLGGSIQSEAGPQYTQLWLQLLESDSSSNSSKGIEQKRSFAPGDAIGSYIIEEILETGGQANIYLASVNRDGVSIGAAAQELAPAVSSNIPILSEPAIHAIPQDVKLVVLKQFILADATQSARLMSFKDFENEYLMLSKLQADNIVKLFDVFIEQRHAFLVLEYLAGGSLRKLVEREGTLSEERVYQIALDVARGLAILHGQEPQLVHRDVSPENIVLDATTGTAKMIDFSFVAKTGNDTQQVVGKQAYISPEQFRGQIAPRNDVYSLGATLYFALTGKEPEAIAQQNPKVMNPLVGDHLNELVMRCTDLDGDSRYQNATQIVEALQGDGWG